MEALSSNYIKAPSSKILSCCYPVGGDVRPKSYFRMLHLSTLLKSGFSPTLKDFNNFLLFLSRNRKVKAIIHLLSQLSTNKINADAQSHTILAKSLMKENKYDDAANFLTTLMGKSQIIDKNRVFDSLVQGICIFNQDPEKGLSLLKDLLEIDNFFPSSRTFCVLLSCFSKIGEMDRVTELLELMSDDKFKYPFDNYVCSSVIAGFIRIEEPELAVVFYETAVKLASLKPNTVTCTAVVTAYCKLRNLDKVSDLVSWMENNELELDLVFYSNWIYGCLREGLICEAFKIFRQMVDRRIELDAISYTILIDGFSKEENVEKAFGILYKMKKDVIQPNLVTYTAIILGFCKKGKLDEALALFGMLKNLGIEADEFTYAILIHGACRNADFALVFDLLDEMEMHGVNPGVVTYNTVINGLCKVGRTSEADGYSKGIDGDAFTYSTLLRGYVEENNYSMILETNRRIQAAGIHLDVVMCNILIKAMLMVGLFEDALAVYRGLPQMNLSANSVTYFSLIDGYCKAGRIDEALEIFDELRRTSISSAACYSCIVSALCRKGFLDMAIDIFSEYIKKDLPLEGSMCMMLIEAIWNRKGAEGVLKLMCRMENLGGSQLHILCDSAVSYLCKMGFPEFSFKILLIKKSKGLSPSSTCYSSVLTTLLCEGKSLLAQLMLTSFIKLHGMSDISICKIILNYMCLQDVQKALLFLTRMSEKKWNITITAAVFKMLTNDGRVLDAYELLIKAENNLPDMNVFTYTIMIDALCKERHIDKALNLCNMAKKKGIALNIVTYNSVINGVCRQGCLVEAFRLFDALEQIDILPTEVTYGTLIDALVKESLLVDARMLFDKMFLKNLVPLTRIYNSLINGYCKSNQLEEAMKLFQALELQSLEPDEFTAAALINGYCQKGDMEGALRLFFQFKSKGLLPDLLGFMHLIRGLCAKGRMEETRSILRYMLQSPSAIDLLRRIENEVESDSVENLLLHLCERGSIDEAVAVLEEVVSVSFPAGIKTSYPELDPNEPEAKDTINGGKMQQLKDFDSVYSLLHTLCSKGDVAEANRLTKLLMES